MDEDNKHKSRAPAWKAEYSVKKSYGFESLDTATWEKFVNDLQENYDLLTLYYEHYSRFSNANPIGTITQLKKQAQKINLVDLFETNV